MASQLGTWQKGKMVIARDLLDRIRPALEQINNILDILIAVLDIALAVLQLAKAVLIGILDPISPLLEALIAEIEAFIRDLRQVGLYVHGDFGPIIEQDFRQLLGGFGAYERRMIARLVDRSDPNRPDFSPRSPVMAFFFHLSVDLTAVNTLIRFIQIILDFFNLNLDQSKALPTPVGLRAGYGFEGLSLFQFGKIIDTAFPEEEDTQRFNIANLSWSLSEPPGADNTLSFPKPPPLGFFVEVSTLRDGLALHYDRSLQSSTGEETTGGTVQARDRGLLVGPDKKPFRLFGGSEQLGLDADPALGSATNLNAAVSGGKIKPGSFRIYGVRSAGDNATIPLDRLKDGEDYLFQRTFFLGVGQAIGQFLTGDRYNIALNYDEMPFDATVKTDSNGVVTITKADRPQTFYVRVAVVSDEVAEREDAGQKPFFYFLQGTPSGSPLALGAVPGSKAKGPLSAPLTLTFPTDNSKEYLETVISALAVLVLGRADLPVRRLDTPREAVTVGNVVIVPAQEKGEIDKIPNPGFAANEIGLEEIATRLFRRLVDDPDDYFTREDVDPISFRKNLLRRAELLANDLYDLTGPIPLLEDQAIEVGKELLTWKWSDAEIQVGLDLPQTTPVETSAEGAETPEEGEVAPEQVEEEPIVDAQASQATIEERIQEYNSRGTPRYGPLDPNAVGDNGQPLSVPTLRAPGQSQQRLHVLADEALREMNEYYVGNAQQDPSKPDLGVPPVENVNYTKGGTVYTTHGTGLGVQSGHRRPFPSREAYHQKLIQEYKNTTAVVAKSAAQAGVEVGSLILSDAQAIAYGKRLIAFNSVHHSGLAVDFGTGGLIPNSRTMSAQRRTVTFQWLEAHAYKFGFRRLPSETWHWNHLATRSEWLSGVREIPLPSQGTNQDEYQLYQEAVIAETQEIPSEGALRDGEDQDPPTDAERIQHIQASGDLADASIPDEIVFEEDLFPPPNMPELTILESLKSTSTSNGVSINPFSVGENLTIVKFAINEDLDTEILGDRQPGYYASRLGSLIETDWSPVIYTSNSAGQFDINNNAQILFCRNLFPPKIYQAAIAVLNLAGAMLMKPEKDGGWIAVRFFPDGIPQIEEFLEEILAFVKALKAGLEAIAKAIRQYIEFIEARIIELQELLKRLKQILSYLLSFDMPAVNLLPVVANGTDGILSALVSAEEKPQDSSQVYGGGMVLLMGIAGLPTEIVDILLSFVQGEGPVQ